MDTPPSTPAASQCFRLYGSGDPGTAELRRLFADMWFPFVFVDVRERDAAGNLAGLADLNTRMRAAGIAKPTVPWLVHPSGVDIGGYDAAIAYADDQGGDLRRGPWNLAAADLFDDRSPSDVDR